MKQERLIQCSYCDGDGKICRLDEFDNEVWIMCHECRGDGVIPDPDDFENTLSDLVQAKEKTYED